MSAAYMVAGKRVLLNHLSEFYRHNGACYRVEGAPDIREKLYTWLERCVSPDKKGETTLVKPNSRMVNDILDSLKSVAHLASPTTPPAWVGKAKPPAKMGAADIVSCANGLLHMPTFTLLPHTPDFFTHNALEFAFDAGASPPSKWLTFLDQLWPQDHDSIDTLQEMFGYCLGSETSQQKAFLIVGPKRSGKGTIARVLTAMVGINNTVAPTLAGLGMNFGLAPLIGKRVGIIGDARLGGKADQAAIAERFLSITGEDVQTIDRKHIPAWTGRLAVRFVVISNELPRFADASGALVSRFIVLLLKESFYGKEDRGLTERLLGELPGILNWAIAGNERLRHRGHFVQPSSAEEAIQDLEDLGSPIGAFLRERCIVEKGRWVVCARLFDEWKQWCEAQGRGSVGTVQTFGRDLRAMVPGIQVSRSHAAARQYEGLGLVGA